MMVCYIMVFVLQKNYGVLSLLIGSLPYTLHAFFISLGTRWRQG